jgi:opacity protein-like surface antigen
MQRLPRVIGALCAVAAGAVSATAQADNAWGIPNPLGFYLGAGVGESTIRSDDPGYGTPGYYDDHHTAFKGIIGIRPVSFLGVEVEYIDFGQPGNHHNYDVNVYGQDSHPRAPVLFGIGYLPIPVPWVDVYAKAGVARLKTTLNDYVCVDSNCNSAELVGYHDETHTKFAYGAGVQTALPLGFSVRAEYERINSQFGDPDAFTVSAVWRF